MVHATYSTAAPTTASGTTQADHTDNSQTVHQQPHGVTEVLKLRLAPRRKAKAVRWAEDTVDNEFMNKKKSKKCCIFHKQKKFGEWSDDDSDVDSDCQNCQVSKEAE